MIILTKKSFLKYSIIFMLITISVIVFYKNTNVYSLDDVNKVATSNSITPEVFENISTVKPSIDLSKQKAEIVLSNSLKEESPPPEFITRLIQLQKQQLHESGALLKIEELPEANQIQLKNWLLSYQKQGYIESSEIALDAIELQNSQVSFVDLNSPSITVPLQKIEDTKLSEYKYLGVVSNETNGAHSSTISSIKRVFSDKMGREISLYESSMVSSKVVMIDEFVSETIKGYPATRMTYCTPSQRCFSQLKLIAKGKLYEITVAGDKASTKDILVDIASSFELPVDVKS